MTTLYEWPPTRSQRAKWALEELEIDYAARRVDLTKGEQHADAYRALQPLGAVPALETDRYAMFESVAIVLQLIDEHPEKALAPAPGSPERAKYYQWHLFAGAEMDPPLMAYFNNALHPLDHMRPPGRPHNATLAGFAKADFEARAEVVSNALEGRDYLLTDGFSGADIAVGHSCFMAMHMGLMEDFPVLKAYYARLSERPAHRRAYGDYASKTAAG